MFRHDQRGDEIDRLPVVGAEVDRASQPHERGARLGDAALRPCGIATPWPRPVEPSCSRASSAACTRAHVVVAGEKLGEARDQARLVARDEIRPHPLRRQQIEKWHERNGLSVSLAGGGRLMVPAFGGLRSRLGATSAAKPGAQRPCCSPGQRWAPAFAGATRSQLVCRALSCTASRAPSRRDDRSASPCACAPACRSCRRARRSRRTCRLRSRSRAACVPDLLARQLDRRLGLVQNLFDAQHDAELMQMVEVARDPLELVRAVLAERRSDFDGMTLNRDLHDGLLVCERPEAPDAYCVVGASRCRVGSASATPGSRRTPNRQRSCGILHVCGANSAGFTAMRPARRRTVPEPEESMNRAGRRARVMRILNRGGCGRSTKECSSPRGTSRPCGARR